MSPIFSLNKTIIWQKYTEEKEKKWETKWALGFTKPMELNPTTKLFICSEAVSVALPSPYPSLHNQCTLSLMSYASHGPLKIQQC